ncbi:unnamed protein product [Arctogadus glacialis]
MERLKDIWSDQTVAYTFEPLRRERLPQTHVCTEDKSEQSDPLGRLLVWSLHNNANCKRSICRQEAFVDSLLGDLSCVTLTRIYQMVCREMDVLEALPSRCPCGDHEAANQQQIF